MHDPTGGPAYDACVRLLEREVPLARLGRRLTQNQRGPGAYQALWHNAQNELSALFERESAPVAQRIEQLTSDYPGRCAVARA